MTILNELEIDAVNGAALFGKIVGAIVGAVATRSVRGAIAGAQIGSDLEDFVNSL